MCAHKTQKQDNKSIINAFDVLIYFIYIPSIASYESRWNRVEMNVVLALGVIVQSLIEVSGVWEGLWKRFFPPPKDC